MKHLILVILSLCLFCTVSSAQQYLDTLSTIVTVNEDTLVSPSSVFKSLPPNVQLEQSTEVCNAMSEQIMKNSKRLYNGFRIRLYFDSCQSARKDAANALAVFRANFPDIPVYHKFESPFFVVTAGDFRTKADAEDVLERVKPMFPAAVVVRAKFKYPDVK